MKRLSKSAMHADAVKLEKLRLVSQKSGRFVQALETQVELGRTAVIGAMKSIYWLA